MKTLRVMIVALLCIVGSVRTVTYPFTTIDTPGFYKLASNVSNQITISASDVTLDMNGATVSGGTNGIVINGGLQNVTLRNGVITSVSSDGIQVGAGCTDITLKDITVTNALRGMNLEQVTNALLRNCDMRQSTTGIELDSCHNIVLENCTARANTHAGFDLISSTTCSLIECSALSTGDSNSDIDMTTVFGFVSANGNGNIFERCIANSTMALSVTDTDSLIAGFALRGDESCTKIINSEAGNAETNVNGFTVPYGVLLEGTLDQVETVTGLLDQSASPFPLLRSTDWSPDGKYNAIAGDDINMNDQQIAIAQFNYVAQEVEIITSISFDTSGNVRDARWSPDGNYIAAGLGLQSASVDSVQIVRFDRPSNSLVTIGSALDNTEGIRAVAWSPDERYLAVGGTSSTTDLLHILSVDRATGRVENVAGALGTGGTFPSVDSVDWSPDGKYVAIGGAAMTGGTGDQFQIFSFDRATNTLTSEDGALSSAFIQRVEWSPDGKYIVAGGESITGGTGNPLQIFSFDQTTDTLSTVTGHFNTDQRISDVRWSPDGKYLCMGGFDLTGGIFQVLRFDSAAPALTFIDGLFNGEEASSSGMAWAPDGQYISLQTGYSGLTNFVNIVSGIQFPQNNVIQGNTVYCNSGNECPGGVGISGSSIANMIIENSAFNNPIPRAANEPIVSSNYQFVTNVFDQLFGEEPSLMQNIATSALTPIAIVPDVPARIKRTELLLESLIDNLL